MAKNKGRRRRKNSRHDDESVDSDCNGRSNPAITNSGEEENSNQNANKSSSSSSSSPHKKHHHNGSGNNKSDLGFAERRELQRKAAAEKRRRKMKCYLCGKTGHARRECPGIADDGRGESKHTKSNGDAGAILLKGKKNQKKSADDCSKSHLQLRRPLSPPPGFSRLSGDTDRADHHDSNTMNCKPAPFLYFDVGCDDGTSILEYLRFGRHGHGCHSNPHSKYNNNNYNNTHRSSSSSSNPHNHTQVSRKDAISEYDASMNHVCETTNFGGCIVRSFLPDNPDEAWTVPQSGESGGSYPFSWIEPNPSLLKFVVGYPFDPSENYNDDDGVFGEATVDRLVETAHRNKGTVLGFFADLDYTFVSSRAQGEAEEEKEDNNNRLRSFQTQRLKCTLRAASRVGCPLQIRISPGYKPCQQSPAIPSSIAGGEHNHASAIDGYALAIRDLGTILLEAAKDPWKVHLSCWNGKAEHLVALEGAFSSKQQQQLCFGFDGSLGFSKAVHLHESAFEVSLGNILLETGGPGVVPPVVAKHGGRNAFCHPGHLPFVAEELARHAGLNLRNHKTISDSDGTETGSNSEITAEYMARRASANTKAFYGWP